MSNEVVLFWGCSMRGGHAKVSQEELKQIVAGIKELGCKLASEHQLAEGIIEKEDKLTPREVHDRDYAWLSGSRAGVFEISNPSLGVGGEIADMLHLGKPVLCLYKGDEATISAYIRGKESSLHWKGLLICRKYATVQEAVEIARSFVDGLA